MSMGMSIILKNQEYHTSNSFYDEELNLEPFNTQEVQSGMSLKCISEWVSEMST